MIPNIFTNFAIYNHWQNPLAPMKPLLYWQIYCNAKVAVSGIIFQLYSV